ncbi:MAG: SDR family NAD(P)-dependent oxidoreductase [Chloroflexi bacterium]|nr:SDR family NAD(P)-dependent oxidoreductase [Chloroflexota bacterium]
MQQLLITGATGFIGGNLANTLAQKGYKVKALARSVEKAAQILDTPKITIIEGDITDTASLEKAVEPDDIVIHLAARYNDPAASYEMYRQSNVVGTENLMKIGLAKSIKRFIHCSTIGVALNSGDPPFDEQSPYSPDPNDFYEVTKTEGERLALRYFREQNLPAVVIRPTQPFGPGDLKKAKFYKLVQKGIVVGSGKVPKHLIYIDDLSAGFELAMQREGIEGEIFILGGDVVTLNDLIGWAAQELGVKDPFRIPAVPMKLLSAAVETVCKPLKIDPPLYRSRLDFFTKGYFFNTDKAANMLGFEPKVPIREGVAKTVDWYKRNNYL